MHRLLLLASLALVASCGDNHHVGGGSNSDGGLIDAAPAPDATVDRCEVLCSCTETYCNDDHATCLAQCQGLDDSVLECRIEHCGYAQTNPSFHCPHALGIANSPGIPQACIQPQ